MVAGAGDIDALDALDIVSEGDTTPKQLGEALLRQSFADTFERRHELASHKNKTQLLVDYRDLEMLDLIGFGGSAARLPSPSRPKKRLDAAHRARLTLYIWRCTVRIVVAKRSQEQPGELRQEQIRAKVGDSGCCRPCSAASTASGAWPSSVSAAARCLWRTSRISASSWRGDRFRALGSRVVHPLLL